MPTGFKLLHVCQRKVLCVQKQESETITAQRSIVSILYGILSKSLMRLLLVMLWALCSIFSLVVLASPLNLSWMWVAAGGKGEINVVAILAFVGLALWVNWWIIFRLPSKVLAAFKSPKELASKSRSLVSKLYGIVSRPLLSLLLLLLWALCSIFCLIVLDSTFNLSWMWPAAEGKKGLYVLASFSCIGLVFGVNWWVIFRLPSNVLTGFKSLKTSVEREQQADETSSREKPDYADIIRNSIDLHDGRVFEQDSPHSQKIND